ncbi:MAG: hypothetical protein OEZ47_10770 [Gammaproteobacteria bacterium]|nr:hypothetical protein [Gammaproteobacteria bacterium]
MTLRSLLLHLERTQNISLLDINGNIHTSSFLEEIINSISNGCNCQSLDCTVAREQVVNSLGPKRLELMADDAPVDQFRQIESLVVAIDEAFNTEALASRSK